MLVDSPVHDEPKPDEEMPQAPDSPPSREEARRLKEEEVLKRLKTGGVYMPPARLKQLQKQIEDKSSAAYQRLAWEALKKRLNGLVNKVNALNLKPIVVELFRENLLRGRGLLARSLMKAQAAALPFTPIYAALVAVLNTKLPEVGDLVLARVVAAFRKAYKRNDKVYILLAPIKSEMKVSNSAK